MPCHVLNISFILIRMTDKTFFNGLSRSSTDIVQKILSLLESNRIDYCLIGGLAVNAYVEPVVSLDLDIVIAFNQIARIREGAKGQFRVEEFPHSLNLYAEDSDLRIQIQTDPRYQGFVIRGAIREVLGYKMKVASLEDVLKGKIWAYSDETRRKSKRQKDLADISRIAESYPHLVDTMPDSIKKLVT